MPITTEFTMGLLYDIEKWMFLANLDTSKNPE
jgi:hypothetical protein